VNPKHEEPTDIRSAKAASRGCEYCSGEGLATIFRTGYDGAAYKIDHDADGVERRVVMRTSAYCVCLAGRWVMDAHRKDSLEVFKRIPDLQDVLTKGSSWWVDDPTEPEYDPNFDVRKAMAEINGNAMLRRTPNRYDAAQRDRETWLLRYLTETLEKAPVALSKIYMAVHESGHGDLKAIRIAGKVLRVQIDERDGDEFWSLPVKG